MTEIWPVIVNFGLPTILLAVLAMAIWRAVVFMGRKLFGDERRNTPGLIDTWLSNLAERMQTHERQQQSMQDSSEKHAIVSDEALRVLIDRDEPPVGVAYVASQAIYRTAANVEQMKSAMLQACNFGRLLATQFPEIERPMIEHCVEIERLIREITRPTTGTGRASHDPPS